MAISDKPKWMMNQLVNIPVTTNNYILHKNYDIWATISTSSTTTAIPLLLEITRSKNIEQVTGK